MDRLSRDTHDILTLLKLFTRKGIAFKF
ncbi:MAG: hypothetical protein JRJ23_05600 [Deltaproteobacteria bacterium]|nr:hypothetical protein [Deltaproteobacteria bacterium]